MSKRGILLLAVVVSGFGASWASQPGQPLDCSDWVILTPGITCSTPEPFCYGAGLKPVCDISKAQDVDNEGRLLYLAQGFIGNCTSLPMFRFELMGWSDGTEQVIAYIEERCGVDGTIDRIGGYEISFDAVNGRVYTVLSSSCYPSPCGYSEGRQLLRFSGFTTLFDVIQSYAPTPDALSPSFHKYDDVYVLRLCF